ncbi:MAG: flavodoxin family protein [Deltaproteobacteria bacterium]
MKALGLVGGPRKGQTTDSMTDAVLKGLLDKGCQIEKVYLYDLNISPCRSCYKCKGTGHCAIQDDDFPALARKFNEADVVVFSSPVYIGNVTSVAKKFMDRGVSLMSSSKKGPPTRTAKRPSRVVLAASCGAPFPFSYLMGMLPGCIGAMKKFFSVMPVKIQVVTASGMDEFDPKRHMKLLDRAYRAGAKIIC